MPTYDKVNWVAGQPPFLKDGLPIMDQAIKDLDNFAAPAVDTIAALKAITVGSVSAGATRYVLGYYAINDGGGGLFRYNSSSSATDNGGTIIAPNAGSGRWERIYAGDLYTKWFGAKNDGTTNDLSAINAAISAAANRGTVHLGYGTIAINGRITVPDGVNLIGAGNGKFNWGTKIKCTAAGAGVSFGVLGYSSENRGSTSGGFVVDGNNVSTNPLYVGYTVQRRLADIDVVNAAVGTAGLFVQQSQNCLFEGINVEDCATDGLRLDRGTGGHVFVRCEFNANGAYNLRITESAAEGTFLYLVPTHINFYGCLFERRTATTTGMVFIEAGENINFEECVLADPDAVAATSLLRVQLLAPYNLTNTIRFTKTTFIGNTTYVTGISADNGTGVSVDKCILLSLLNAFSIAIGATVEYVSGLAPPNNVTNIFAGAGSNDSYIRHRLRSPLEVTRPSSTEQVVCGFVAGDAGQRMRLEPGKLGFGSGADYAQDVVLARTGTSTLGITGDVTINGGTAIKKHLSGTATWDPASITAGGQTSTTVTVTGAVVGDTVAVGFSQAVPAAALLVGAVTAANTVTVTLYNIAAGTLNLASGTLRADVWGH